MKRDVLFWAAGLAGATMLIATVRTLTDLVNASTPFVEATQRISSEQRTPADTLSATWSAQDFDASYRTSAREGEGLAELADRLLLNVQVIQQRIPRVK